MTRRPSKRERQAERRRRMRAQDIEARCPPVSIPGTDGLVLSADCADSLPVKQVPPGEYGNQQPPSTLPLLPLREDPYG